jgi:HEAT repeat protein
LAPLVHSEDKDTRRYTARALGWIASPKKIEALSILSKDAQEQVRTEVLMALGRSDASIIGPLLVQFLKDDLIFLRSESARLLGSTSPELAAGPLIDALNDRDPLVRINAANSLSSLGAVSAIETLKSRIRKAENAEEAAYYQKALRQLGVNAAD